MTAVALVILTAAVVVLAAQIRKLRAEVAVLAARLAAVAIVDEASRRVAVDRRRGLRPVPRGEE